ncbi:unnamed protein product [Amoebophrya sp. A120]|nr:unnamed protein product [Amoebophrya sp. A120]|eukprot:GSA120T00026072001.1
MVGKKMVGGVSKAALYKRNQRSASNASNKKGKNNKSMKGKGTTRSGSAKPTQKPPMKMMISATCSSAPQITTAMKAAGKSLAAAASTAMKTPGKGAQVMKKMSTSATATEDDTASPVEEQELLQEKDEPGAQDQDEGMQCVWWKLIILAVCMLVTGVIGTMVVMCSLHPEAPTLGGGKNANSGDAPPTENSRGSPAASGADSGTGTTSSSSTTTTFSVSLFKPDYNVIKPLVKMKIASNGANEEADSPGSEAAEEEESNFSPPEEAES